jgi:hypothetical protein
MNGLAADISVELLGKGKERENTSEIRLVEVRQT